MPLRATIDTYPRTVTFLARESPGHGRSRGPFTQGRELARAMEDRRPRDSDHVVRRPVSRNRDSQEVFTHRMTAARTSGLGWRRAHDHAHELEADPSQRLAVDR
jgi:hypothetical protein